jgi:hypothetical protein
MQAVIDLILSPKVWAYIVTAGLAAAQITATSAQTEMIVGGVTAALMLVVHKFVKGKEKTGK